ncbi:NAD-dependent epimerase/dehydratase family protein [Roseovarius spongiae]|uniref:UDP-glucose 4-epimerase n=1 Tax=Roseovarius spongiae TaxID=2320272 RepID=A0A3A8B024_9RHOB|nr:NAD-dependent epimerase/dehydratase family protein [Roseovarius spongiae]RKF16720.1 NAD-dependent epimerase/dehydratase family protein [Roseovarius spongiae]
MPALDFSGPDWLMVGASGMVGRLMRGAWADDPGIAARLVAQLRRDRPAGERVLYWSPLDGIAPLERHARGDGPPAALIMLAGVIPAPMVDYSVNVSLAVACLEAARAVGCERVLIASSAAVYGPADAPLPESAPCRPVSTYGASKLAMERACAPWRAAGMDVCCLRIGNVVGADALLRNARAGGPVRVDRFADGAGPVRPYIGPESLSRILGTLATWPAPLPDTLNVAAPQPLGMEEIAEAARLDWRWADAPAQAVRRVTLDTAQLEAFHAFDPDECSAKGMVAQFRRAGQAP